MTRRAVDLSAIISAFAISVPQAQQQIDRWWVEELQSLPAPLLDLLRPARQVVVESELSTAFTTEGRQTSEGQASVRLLNLGYRRTFAHSNFTEHKLTIRVVSHSWTEEKLHG